MNLPLGFGRIDWSDWIRGAMAAFVTGGASAVASGLVVSLKDPKDYAIGTWSFFQLVGAVFIMSGTLNLFAFLRTKPIPDLKQVTITTQTIAQEDRPTKTVKTVQETSIEPVKPEKP